MSQLRLISRAQTVVVAYETGLIVPTATTEPQRPPGHADLGTVRM